MDIEHDYVSEKKRFHEMKTFDKIVTRLIQHGARVDIEDKYGRTPLYYAAMYHQDALVHYLSEE